MPTRLFNRLTNKILLALGGIMLLYYWDWLTQQLNNDSQIQDNSVALTLLSAFISQYTLWFIAVNNSPLLPEISLKQKLSDLVMINRESTGDYTPHHQKLDRDFVIQALFQIYQENLSDRCKIICLLNKDKFKFKIMLASEVTFKKFMQDQSKYLLALYKESNQKVYIRRNVRHENLNFFKQILSHELRHAADVYDNKQNGVWPVVFDGKLTHRLFLWGALKQALPNNGFPQEQLQDLQRVKYLIEQDIQNLKVLHTALNHPQKRSPEDKETLAKLATILKAYHYNFTLSKEHIQAVVDMLAETHSYNYDAVSENYRPNNHLYSFEYNDQMFYVREYNLKHKPGLLVTLTDGNIESDERRLKDLFLNLEKRFETINIALKLGVYNNMMLPSEYAAAIDEVLAPFSQPLNSSEITLREMIFPNLVKIEKERRSEEHNNCLLKM